MRRQVVVAGVTAIVLVSAYGCGPTSPGDEAPTAAGEAAADPSVSTDVRPRITATLFYGSADGETLVPVQQEIALGEGVMAQGREIVTAQLQPAPAQFLPVIPAGTTLRAFYVTDRGDAFVDLSPEISTAHAGGSSTELLTVYAIVNAVTANLPTVRRVQILINGQEADTLAGHIDLRSPLERDPSIVSTP